MFVNDSNTPVSISCLFVLTVKHQHIRFSSNKLCLVQERPSSQTLHWDCLYK